MPGVRRRPWNKHPPLNFVPRYLTSLTLVLAPGVGTGKRCKGGFQGADVLCLDLGAGYLGRVEFVKISWSCVLSA